ncbi:phosphonate ABC transporter ATP-binding protein [Epidermidibacterium keratini]|uniref:Phosphonate ABC transporter ATP-binding protein n=1 Tax=Epidermidibacterium keratini TaxID=1891644 RepID=A0A7L4YT77_9ACTN|nr:phosphonate ABC transporter ATP-binding protein [Epidermidibacterium keratini]QHC02183.1 phosphonate ABC transporter ATP-binding protein [Epidermidibacterium keratini]
MISTAHLHEASAPTAVQLDHVTKRFERGQLGLDDVTVDFPRGTITVLLGLSGSGKSTLLRHINGLQRPTSGTIEVLGNRIEKASDRELRKVRQKVGFIFQHFHLVGPMTVLENVCTGRLGAIKGPRFGLSSYPKQVRRDAMDQLARVGLADRAFQRADTLSGGQQQRIAIARALVQEPDVLLADEPVASLDPVTGIQVIDLITRIAREEDLTVICSLHQVELALGFADRIVGLRAGKVVLDRQTSSLRREDALAIYDKVAAVPTEDAIARTELVG